MKKTSAFVIVVSLCILFASNAMASGFGDEVSVFVNGYPIKLSYPAAVENGRVLVPFRDIFEALEMEVSWDGETNTVSGGDANSWVSFVLGQNTATVDGRTVNLDVPARAINGHTLVPVRFVGEATGFGVEWDQANHRVIVGDKTIHGDILLTSTLRKANAYQLYAAGKGVGEFTDYTKILGYPGDDEFAVYYQNSVDGPYKSLNLKYEDLRGLDLNEKVSWKYNGQTYTNTRLEVYNFCRDASGLASKLGMSTYDAVGVFSPQWLLDTFGQVYLDCQRGWLFEQDMEPIAEGYISALNGTVDSNPHRDNMTLTPDAVFVPVTEEDGWIEDRFLEEYGLTLGTKIVQIDTGTGYAMAYTLEDADTHKVLLELGVINATSEAGELFNGVRIKCVERNGNDCTYVYKQSLIDLGFIKE